VIVGPLGDILAGPLYDQSGILIADVDLRDIIRAKYDFDPLGHYSRPVRSCVLSMFPFYLHMLIFMQ
jgi:hypothetical protein